MFWDSIFAIPGFIDSKWLMVTSKQKEQFLAALVAIVGIVGSSIRIYFDRQYLEKEQDKLRLLGLYVLLFLDPSKKD